MGRFYERLDVEALTDKSHDWDDRTAIYAISILS